MIKLRASQIIIDLPTEESRIWAGATIQEIIKNDQYETQQTVDDVYRVNRCMCKVATEMATFTDPVTEQEHTLSAAGASAVVKAFITKWMQEDLGGTINELQDLVLEG